MSSAVLTCDLNAQGALDSPLRQAGLRPLEKKRPSSAGSWWDDPANPDLPPLEIAVEHSILSLGLEAPWPGAAVSDLPDWIDAMLRWTGQERGWGKFGWSPGRLCCLRSELPWADGDAGESLLLAQLRDLREAWRACRSGKPGRILPATARPQAKPDEGQRNDPGKGSKGSDWRPQVDPEILPRGDDGGELILRGGTALVSLRESRIRAEVELADLTGWPALNRNAAGLVLLRLNSCLKLSRAAWERRDGRWRALLLAEAVLPLAPGAWAAVKESLEVGLSCCGREIRSLASSAVAEKYLEMGWADLAGEIE